MPRLFDSKQFRTDLQLSGSFSGSFEGSGANLTNIPASAIGGLNLSQIASGSFSASVSQNGGLSVNTDITASSLTVNGNILLPDGGAGGPYIGLGDAQDLKIFHNGGHSIVRETGVGSLYLQSDNNVILSKDSNTELMVKGIADGAVELYHDNVKKFETTADGIYITGSVTASGNISASSINAFEMNVTHFTASFITASTIQTSGSNIFGDESSDTHTFIGNIIAQNNISSSGYISGSVFSGDGSGLVNIPASGITGLNLSQIASGSVTASIAPDKGFQVNTNITASGNIRMQTAAPSILIQRTNNSNNASIDFIGQAGATGAQIQFSGSSNELTFGTYDGSSVIERLRIEDGTTPNIIITGSTNISGSATSTASFGTYIGDGSGLTGLGGVFGISDSNGSFTYYSDLSSSLQAATAGDTIQLFANHTEASDHIFHLKDKVDFNFNGNELFISASATLDGVDMFSDNDIAVSCSFYNGRIRFTQATTYGIFNRLLYIDNAASEINNIGFEWEVERGTNASPYYPIRNDGTLIGGKFIGGPSVFGYLIQTYGTLKHLDVYASKGILFNGYLKKHYNLNVHTYGEQAAAEATNTYVYDSYFHAETGQALSAFYVINCTIIADNGAGVSGTRRLINSTIRNANGIGASLTGEMIGGSVYTENNVSIAAGDSEVLGVAIYNKDYLGPGVTVSNGEISNCAIIDDYAYSGQKSIEVNSGATSPTITNCSFDFLNNSTNNVAITAIDDDTPVFFANNTFKNCTPTNPTKVIQAISNVPDQQGNINVSSSLDNNRIYSGSFSGSYVGDGSQLSGIVTETNFTQSLFVTPSGNNSTAVVGDMMKPFSSILAATGSANPGDTIIVYPGTYIEDRNLYKDGVNYHFLDGAKVVANSPVEPMWGGGTGQSNGVGTSFDSPISITGHGEFISTSSNAMASAIFYIQAPSGVIEFKRALKHGIGGGAYQTAAGFGQLISIDPTGVLTVRGKIENSGSASSYCSTAVFGQGNINTDIVVRSYNGTADGVRLWSDSGDINGTMDVYSEGTGLLTQARTSALSYLRGRFETLTSNQGTSYALYFGPGYRGSFHVDAEIRGAIYINPGGAYEGSVHVRGYQEVSNSPGGGANVIGSGDNQLSQKIYGVSGNAAFKVTGGRTTYDGQVRVTGYNSKVFDISAGTFYWKGSCAGSTGYPTTRTDPNVVSGGELIIESQFETFSQAASVNNEYMFNLSGGTLDIQSKLRNNIDQANNGIINMTGGYLRMNSAELVHATQTGSFAYAIDLNGQTHSGSILNNCFTNLQPFNSGSFTNEIIGGGTLFESHKLY